MKKTTVITYGTFDMFHYGHLKLLERCKSLGDYLIVAVSTDEFNKVKGKISLFPYEHRKSIVEQIKYVDMVIPETSWEQKIEDVKKYNVDIFAIGDDWKGKFDFLKEYCEVVYLPRTPTISTTEFKTLLSNIENLKTTLSLLKEIDIDKLDKAIKFIESIKRIV